MEYNIIEDKKWKELTKREKAAYILGALSTGGMSLIARPREVEVETHPFEQEVHEEEPVSVGRARRVAIEILEALATGGMSLITKPKEVGEGKNSEIV